MAKVSEIAALFEEARALVNEQHGGDAGQLTPQETAKNAIDRLAYARSADDLDGQRLDMSKLVNELSWTGKKANKPLKRQMLTTFESSYQGGPVYPAAVEMVGFYTAALLHFEPDARARIFELAETTPRAYAPIRRLAYTHQQVDSLLGHFPAKRQEQMLSQLWEIAHMPRWWDEVVPGLITPEGGPEVDLDLDDTAVAGMNADDAELLRRTMTQPTVNDAQTPQVRSLKLPSRTLRAVEAVADGGIDADIRCGIASLTQIRGANRPPSPISQLLDALQFSLDGGDPKEVMPRKPRDFRELFCDVDLEVFPTPEPIAMLRRAQLQVAGQTATVRVMRNSQQLLANRRFMGNCTGGFARSSSNGNAAIVAVHMDDGEVANVSFIRGNGYYGGDGDQGWRIGEVNGRFNRRTNIPDTELHRLFSAVAEQINAGNDPDAVDGVTLN